MPTLSTGQDASLWFIGGSCLLKFGIDTIGITFRTDVRVGCQDTALLVRIFNDPSVPRFGLAS